MQKEPTWLHAAGAVMPKRATVLVTADIEYGEHFLHYHRLQQWLTTRREPSPFAMVVSERDPVATEQFVSDSSYAILHWDVEDVVSEVLPASELQTLHMYLIRSFDESAARIRRALIVGTRRTLERESFARDQLPHRTQSAQSSQALLPLQTPFAPSRKLVDFWVRGITALRSEASDVLPDYATEAFSIDPDEVRAQFGKRIGRMFSTIGNRLRYTAGQGTIVGKDGRFSVPIQNEILDRIYVRPDEGSEFFALLYQELMSSIAHGSGVAGKWGQLVARDGQIRFELNVRNANHDKHPPRAKITRG